MPRRPPKIGQNQKFSTYQIFLKIFPWRVWWRFLLRQNLLFGAKIEVKNWKNFEKFLFRQEKSNFKIFRPSLRSGRNFKSGNLLKLRESPFPLYPPPRSSLTARSRPVSYASAAAQNWPKPKIFNLKIFSKFFPMRCMMTFFAKAKPAILSQNRGQKISKFGKILKIFLFIQEIP